MDSMIYKRKSPLLVFLIPAFLLMTIFLYYPFLDNVLSSMYNTTGLGMPNVDFNGISNYTRMFGDTKFILSLKNTMLLMGCTVVFQLGMAIILALMVDNLRHGAQFFRTVFFFPIVISATALGLLFNMIFLYDIGLMNDVLLNKLQWSKELIDYKGDHSFIVMAIPVVWQYVGYYFVILLTGLANISEDIYEAAAIDGVSGIQKIRYITLPLLYNTIVTCLTLCVTGALKVFDLPWTMFPNGVSNTFLTGSYMFANAYQYQYIGYAAAIAVFIVVLGIVLAQFCDIVFKPKDY